MRSPSRALLAAILAAVLAASCAAPAGVARVRLECQPAWLDSMALALWSFDDGPVAVVPGAAPGRFDLMLYYDADDCTDGALLGPEERIGHLFPVGDLPWEELCRLEPPTASSASVIAIHPLTADRVGEAFWVRVGAGEFVLVRIRSIRGASPPERLGGAVAGVELEWWRPPGPDFALRNDPDHTLDARPMGEETCRVHRRPCLEDWVDTRYGLIRPISDQVGELWRRYPNVNDDYLAGCIVRPQPKALVYACPDCRVEFFAEFEALPEQAKTWGTPPRGRDPRLDRERP